MIYSLSQTKDEESAFKLLCQFMHIYSYRDVYSPDLSVLQVCNHSLTHSPSHSSLLTTHSLTHPPPPPPHTLITTHSSTHPPTHTHTLITTHSSLFTHSLTHSHTQLQLYQLSRLLHDVLPTLHSHLTGHEITPFYYAAPWFLTLFSSQFPIAFVARVMGRYCVYILVELPQCRALFCGVMCYRNV